MVGTRHLKVGAACVFALVACARLAHAQATGPAAAADTREVNLRAYVELLRSDLRAQKVAIITEVMQFTEAEDAKFWPVYREYEAELAKINDDRIALIKEYAANYDTLTDATADRLAQRALDLEARRHALKVKLLRSLQVGAPAEDGGAVPPGRESDPAAPRSADRGVAAHRVEVTVMRTPLLVFSTVAAVIAIGSASLSADRVRLRSGQAVTGSFMSADVKIVRLLLDNGRIAEFPVDDVTAVEFTPRKAPADAGARSCESAAADHRADGHRAQRPPHAGDRGRRRAGRHDLQVGARRSGDDRRTGGAPARRGRRAAGREGRTGRQR